MGSVLNRGPDMGMSALNFHKKNVELNISNLETRHDTYTVYVTTNLANLPFSDWPSNLQMGRSIWKSFLKFVL